MTGTTSSTAPSANVNNEVMTGMFSMQSIRNDAGFTFIKLININDKPVTVGVEDNNLSTAYAAINNDPARAAAALRGCNIKVDWSIKDTTMLSMVAGNAKMPLVLSVLVAIIKDCGFAESWPSMFSNLVVDEKEVSIAFRELYPIVINKFRRLAKEAQEVPCKVPPPQLVLWSSTPCGEFTVDSCGNFDPAFNLCISDITILSDSIHLKLKISKTDPFRQGVTIKLFETGTEICPYRICCLYMNSRFQRNPSPETPLFVDLTGAAVTRAKFLSLFKHALDSLGIDSTYYSGHSFRIGAATTAGSVQVEDHLIKVMGRWSSDAYCRYIKISESDLKRAQNSLAKN
ncbi:unnamed protein product [Mytilus edulis]|uniref:Retrovirus-related Pol poly from transposon 412 n=1 Tax=Mytilus edulis TaxID=6550 RepID=A0A8S3RAA4_MYTED|nr:unnamed protein product [Mytilus edulis]